MDGFNAEWLNAELTFYKRHLESQILPFWNQAIDSEFGGVFTCFTNSGERRISTDKFTWSQGRFLWLWSRLASCCSRGLVGGDAEGYRAIAAKTFRFIDRHAFLPDGSCSFLLTREGKHKEAIPGLGYDVSFYADCFVILGYTEYARVTRDTGVLEKAFSLYRHVEGRLQSGSVRSEPYPIPPGYGAHGFSMIMLNVSHELADALEELGDARHTTVRGRSLQFMVDIMERFCGANDLVMELIPSGDKVSSASDSLLARHVNPGHTLECMWFVLTAARKLQREDIVARAMVVTAKAMEIGWDREYGGLFRYVDREGGAPKGRLTDGDRRFERLVADTWDMKLWWPHSEALYTTLLCHLVTGASVFYDLYSRLKEYTFRTFPHPNPSIGEWVQIRDRKGNPVDAVVALPVKDPYHIMRNLLLLIEVLEK
ncbi:AGE family epimerase/isomerase [Paenibacillus sp.]|uniref:AGE family epimerase/isomerase n=1 Tax=Paenibacillus sp. TaxID=58172 RepID=UPI00281247B6|nr:AGE family epimerase/isomerase [Paenibacillus sp.]